MKAESFQGTVKKYMILRHIRTMEQLRAHTTVGSNKTFLKYWHDPELIPLGVYMQIMKTLNVPLEEQFELLKGGKV